MLKNVSKKLSAVLAVSAIATIFAPTPFKAMKGWGQEANNFSPSSSSKKKELNTYFQIIDFAAHIGARIFKSEKERLLAQRRFYTYENPQELTNQQLLKSPLELLAGCICERGREIFRNLRLDSFDDASQSVLIAADNWYRTKTQDEKTHEKQDFFVKTKDACSEGAKKRQIIEHEFQDFEAKQLELVARAAALDPFIMGSLIPQIIANGVAPSFDLNGNDFPEPIQNLIKEADELHQYAQKCGLFKS